MSDTENETKLGRHKILEVIEEYKDELVECQYVDLLNILGHKKTLAEEVLYDEVKKLREEVKTLEEEKNSKQKLAKDTKTFIFDAMKKIFSSVKNGLGNTYRQKILDIFESCYCHKTFKYANFKNYIGGYYNIYNGKQYSYEWTLYPLFKLDLPKEYYKNLVRHSPVHS